MNLSDTWKFFGFNVNTLEPRQNPWHFVDNIFTCICFKENNCVLIYLKCLWEFNCNESAVGSDNSFASNRSQTAFATNGGHVWWRICQSTSMSQFIQYLLPSTQPPTCAAFMCPRIRYALVQVMAWRLLVTFSAPSHYLNQCWLIFHWTPRNQFSEIRRKNTNDFIHENAFSFGVCEMVVIL